MSDVPAGWYPDPSAVPSASMLRYWDGLRWTEHLHHQAPAPYGAQPTPTTPDGQPLAGWWHRVGATMIDGIFATIISLVVTLPTQISMQREQARLSQELERRIAADDSNAYSWYFHQVFADYRHHAWIYLIPAVIIVVGYTVFLHLAGGTPGQLITGLRTRRRDAPGPLSWGRAAARVVAYAGATALLEALALVSGSWVVFAICMLVALIWTVLNPLWAAWDSKRQALHDKLVGTNVVRVRR